MPDSVLIGDWSWFVVAFLLVISFCREKKTNYFNLFKKMGKKSISSRSKSISDTELATTVVNEEGNANSLERGGGGGGAAAAELADNVEKNSMRSKTRVCIKQLPPNITEEKLRRHLLSCPTATASKQQLLITDCRIVRTKGGKSRHMAYVGFKEASMASFIISYFHNSFLHTNRILVEAAFLPNANKQLNDASLTYRPWSNYSVGSSKYAKLHPNTTTTSNSSQEETAVSNTDKEGEQDIERKKQEFLSVMQSRTSKGKTWSNDDDFAGGRPNEHLTPTPTTNTEAAAIAHRQEVTSGAAGEDQKKDPEKQRQNMSNLEFLQSKVVAKDELSEEEEDHSSNNDDESSSNTSSASSSSQIESFNGIQVDHSVITMDEDELPQKKLEKEENEVTKHTIVSSEDEEDNEDNRKRKHHLDPKRLFVRNLPFNTTVEELREVFQPFGSLIDIHIPIDDLKRNKGFAFVQYEDASAASMALLKLDGTDFQGRLMHIIVAQKATPSTALDEGTSSNYRSQKEVERKNMATTTTTGWNTNFVRGDAVVDGLAHRLGLRKGDILNVTADGLSSGDAAVRLALGETHVINENIEYFASHGIDMTTLFHDVTSDSNTKKRSSTKILVKNLPYCDHAVQELMKVFTAIPRGVEPTQILVPPSRAVAIVTYAHENDAKRAFRALAYKRFKNVPLYLEWAPLAAFRSSKDDSSATSKPLDESSGKGTASGNANAILTNNDSMTISTATKEGVSNDHDDEEYDNDVAYSIYVKNLNFATKEESLKKLFETIIPVRTVRIPTKLAPVKVVQYPELTNSSRATERQSMGFGFVECHTVNDAKKAIRDLQGKLLDGYALELSLSRKSNKEGATDSPNMKKKKKLTTKLLVRNVPFEATRIELYKLFGTYGSLKQVRLPKKMDGSHRGFAFVEYVSAEDAQNAMVKLSGTHLYGRHLVLAWSDDTEEEDQVLQSLRNKAKRDLHQHQQFITPIVKNKKIRFDT